LADKPAHILAGELALKGARRRGLMDDEGVWWVDCLRILAVLLVAWAFWMGYPVFLIWGAG